MTLSLPSAFAAATSPSMPPKSAIDVAVFGSPPPPPDDPVASLEALDPADEASLAALDPALEPALSELEPQAASVNVTTAKPANTDVPTRAERTSSSSR